MKYLIVVCVLLMASMAHAAEQREFHVKNAGGLVEICSVANGDTQYEKAMAFCHGYLVGSYQYYKATVNEGDRFICEPNPTPSLDEVMNGFVVWSKKYPQYINDKAVDTLFRYLAENYPCGKSK
jgi:hypothetical protein